MASQAISFTDPNPALCNPWMDRDSHSLLGPCPPEINRAALTADDLKAFIPLDVYKEVCHQWLEEPEIYLIRCALETLGIPAKEHERTYKWIKFGTPFILKIELFARSLFKILNTPGKINYLCIQPELFANMIAFLEERVSKLEAKQEGSKVSRRLSKAASAMKLSLPRKKVYHWERYAGEENKTIPLADQIIRLRAVILTFHACYCTDHKEVYMKDAVRLVKAVVHLKEAKLEQAKLEQARLEQATKETHFQKAKLQETKTENTSLTKAFALSPTLKEMSPEKREEVAEAPIYSAVLKILEFIRSDTRPIAQEQTDYLMKRIIQEHRKCRNPDYAEKRVSKLKQFEPIKIGEANILKHAYHRTGLLIDPISGYTWQGVEDSSDKRLLMYDRYEVAQLLIQEEGYVFRAEGSAPTHIEGATAPSKEEAYEASSTGSDSLPPSPPSHTGYGMGAGMGAGAVDNVPPPEVPSQHSRSRTPSPTAPSPEPTAPIAEVDIFDKGGTQQENEPLQAKVLVNGKWIQV